MEILHLAAKNLLAKDVIHFGDDICFVVGVDLYDEKDREMALVTEGVNGAQFIDYMSIDRVFTVARAK